MAPYEHALLTDRLSHLEALARRQQTWAEARRAMNDEQRRAPARVARGLGLLRLRVRRSLKGRRSLA